MDDDEPKQLLSEFLLEAELGSKKHIIVEGPADKRFLQVWLRQQRLAPVITVVSTLNIPMASLEEIALNEGSRSRVILVARRAVSAVDKIRCIADRDAGQDVAEHQYPTLIWTDYPSVESYAIDAETLDAANLLSFGERLPPSSDLMPGLSFALRELFAVRTKHPHLPKPKFSNGIPKKGTLADFDVKKAVSSSTATDIDNLPRSNEKDPRSYAYGHDIGELLLAAFPNTLKNQAGLGTLEAVESALRSALQATGAHLTTPLFTSLAAWLKSSGTTTHNSYKLA
jgi:hypothetical protein